MALQNAIMDVRNMKRSLALRQEPDQAKIVSILEQILKDAVVAQASGSRIFQKKAYEEMVQIRKDMLSHQVHAGASQEAMVGIYSHMIDQMDRMQSDNQKTNKAFDSAIGELGKSIPSVDTFISALMTANPLLGYGVKIIRDIGRSSRAYSNARQKESRERMKQLEAQEAYIEKQMKELALKERADEQAAKASQELPDAISDAIETGLEPANEVFEETAQEVSKRLEAVEQAITDSVDDAQKDAEKQEKKIRDPNKPKRQYTKGGIYRKILEEIRDEMTLLRKEWTGDLPSDLKAIDSSIAKTGHDFDVGFEKWHNNPYEGQLTSNKLSPTQVNNEVIDQEEAKAESENQVVTALEAINDSIHEQTEAAEDNTKKLIRVEEDNEKDRKRDEKLKKLGEDHGPGVPDIKAVGDVLESQKGGFTSLLDKMMAPLLFMVRSAIGTFVLGVGAFVTEFIAIPAMIGTAIYKLLDGFFNAEKIIGKSSEDITMLDRVKAGVANIWGSVFKLVDWVLELFGFDLFDSKDMEKKIYKVMDGVQNKIVDVYKSSIKFVQEKYESITKGIGDFFEKIENFFTNIYKFFSDKIDSFTNIFSAQGIKNWFGDTFSWGDKTPEQNQINTVPQVSEEYSGTIDRSPPVQVPAPGTGVVERIISNPKNIEVQQQNGKNVTDSMNRAEQNANNGAANSSPVIVAPNNQSSTVNNHNYQGSPSTSNKDPDFRSFQNRDRFVF